MQKYDNDYYFNENYNKTQEIFNNSNIFRPKLDYNSAKKRNKNLLLTIGTRLNTVNNTITNNNYVRNKELLINRSFKVSKNKYVICRKNNFSNNIKENMKDNESKSMENHHNNNNNNEREEDNIRKYLIIKDIDGNSNNTNSNFFSSIKEKCFRNDINNENENNVKNPNIFNTERKYKNIVLRPYKIQKENQLKHNIKVNKEEIDDSPKIINKIMTKLNIKPKNSRVFKYK